MARKAQLERALHPERMRFAVRVRNRCRVCGRPRSFLRKFEMCRICFRNLSLRGDIAGVIKSSW